MLNTSQIILFENYKNLNKQLVLQTDILILKTTYKTPLENKSWNVLLAMLPDNLVTEVNKYKRWEDQHNALLGKLLVFLGSFILKGKKINFEHYKRDKNNKPFLEANDLKFNISHSGKTIVCALSQKKLNLGIDVEEVKNIDIEDLKYVYHNNEYEAVKKGNDVKKMYRYWTRKEAFIKAISKPITVPLHTIDTTDEVILYEENHYHLKTYQLNNLFCSLAFTMERPRMYCVNVEF